MVDFTDLQGNASQLGRYIAEEVGLGILNARKGLVVVERNLLGPILQERKRAEQGLIDPATAQKLKVSGVEMLVTGTMTEFGDRIHVVMKVMDTGTAALVAGRSFDMAKTPAVIELGKGGLPSAGSQTGEITVNSGTGAQSAGGSNPSRETVSGTADDATFANEVLRATVRSLTLSPDRRRAVLTFTVENISGTDDGTGRLRKEAISLAGNSVGGSDMPANISPTRGIYTTGQMASATPKMSLNDNRGNRWLPVSLQGIQLVETNSFTTVGTYSRFGPSQRAVLTATFAAEGTVGSEFTFSLEVLCKAESGKGGAFSISFAGIKPAR